MGAQDRAERVDEQFSKIVAGSSECSFDHYPLGEGNYKNNLVIESREPVYEWEPDGDDTLCKSKRTISKV